MNRAGGRTGWIQRFLFLLSALFFLPANATETTIAVASNFTGTMKTLVNAFELQTGHQVRVASGSSGSLYAQISHGAPFDAFLSADSAKPKSLMEAGRAVPGSGFTYARGTLVLWSAQAGGKHAPGDILKQGNFDKLALANPRLAPYGAAAVEILENLGIVDQTRAHWVQGENIAQTYQFVASGNAGLGFVAYSQITANGKPTKGSIWIVPHDLYHPIRQDAVLLQHGAKNQAARAFLAFLQQSEAGKIIEASGYILDQVSTRASHPKQE